MPLDQFNRLPSYPYRAEMSIALQYGIWAKAEGICDLGCGIADCGFGKSKEQRGEKSATLNQETLTNAWNAD